MPDVAIRIENPQFPARFPALDRYSRQKIRRASSWDWLVSFFHVSKGRFSDAAITKAGDQTETALGARIIYPAISRPVPDNSPPSDQPAWREVQLRLWGLAPDRSEIRPQGVDVINALPEMAHGLRVGCSRDLGKAADFLEKALQKLDGQKVDLLKAKASGDAWEKWRDCKVALRTRQAVLQRWSERMKTHVIAGPEASLFSKTRAAIAAEVTEPIRQEFGWGPDFIARHEDFMKNVGSGVLTADTVKQWCREAEKFVGPDAAMPALRELSAVETLYCRRVAGCETINAVTDLWAARLENCLTVDAATGIAEDELPPVEFSVGHNRTIGFKLNPNISLFTFLMGPFVKAGPYVEPAVQAQRNRATAFRVSGTGRSLTFTVIMEKTDELRCGVEAGFGAKVMMPVVLSAGAFAFGSVAVNGSASDGVEVSFTIEFDNVKGKSIDDLREEARARIASYVEAIDRTMDASIPIKGAHYEERASLIKTHKAGISGTIGAALSAAAAIPSVPAACPSGVAGAAGTVGAAIISTKRKSVGSGEVHSSIEISGTAAARVIAGGKPGAPQNGHVAEASVHTATADAGLARTATLAFYKSERRENDSADAGVASAMPGGSEGVAPVIKVPDAEVGSIAPLYAPTAHQSAVCEQTAPLAPARQVSLSPSDVPAGRVRFRNWSKLDSWLKTHTATFSPNAQARFERLREEYRDCKLEVTYQRVDGTWQLTLHIPAQPVIRKLGISSSYLFIWDNRVEFSGVKQSIAFVSNGFEPPLSLRERVRRQLASLWAVFVKLWAQASVPK